MKRLSAFLIVALSFLAAPAQAVDVIACRIGTGAGIKSCASPLALAYVPTLDVAHLPSGIPAPNIGGGGVTNTAFGYIATLTGDAQAQINAVVASAANAVLLTGNQTVAGVKTLTSPPVFSAASVLAGTLPNAGLVNSSLTLSCTGLSGCGVVALGATLTITVDPVSLVSGIMGILGETHGGFGADISGLGIGFVRRSGAALWSSSALLASEIPSAVDAAKIADGSVSNAEFQRIDGVMGPIQAQLDGKANTSHAATHRAGQSDDLLSAPGAIGGTTPAAVTGTAVTATSQFTGSGAGLTSIPNSALTNPSVTIGVSSGLSSNCSPVALGSTCTVSLGTELAGVAGVSSNGYVVRTGSGAYAPRTFVAGIGTTVANGDGSSGNTSINVTYGTAANTALVGNSPLIPTTAACCNWRVLMQSSGTWGYSSSGAPTYVMVAQATGSGTQPDFVPSTDVIIKDLKSTSQFLPSSPVTGEVYSYSTAVGDTWVRAQANAAATSRSLCVYQGSSGQCMMVGSGVCRLQTGITLIINGDMLYVSATQAGTLTNVPPTGSGQYVSAVGWSRSGSSGLVGCQINPDQSIVGPGPL